MMRAYYGMFILLVLVTAVCIVAALPKPANCELWIESQTTNHESPVTNHEASPSDVPELIPGKPIEREMAGGETHAYRISLVEGQYLHLVVEQRGIDVVVRRFGPDGQQIVEMDSPNGNQGPEPLWVVTEATGQYRLEVEALEKEAVRAKYEIRIEELRAATRADKDRLVAQNAFAEGERLRLEATAQSLRAALPKYEEALRLYEVLGDRQKLTDALHQIGVVYHSLGLPQKARESFRQALLVEQAIGDRRGQGATLDSLGVVSEALGEIGKALDYHHQALRLWQELKDRLGQAYALNNIGNAYLSLGEPQKALEYLQQALPLWKTLADTAGEALTLNNIGGVYDGLGEKQQALNYYSQAFSLFRTQGDHACEAITRNNIGNIYKSLGQNQRAVSSFDQALAVFRAVGDRRHEAMVLHNLGGAYNDLGEKRKALDYLSEALLIKRDIGDRRSEAYTLNLIGGLYWSLSDLPTALNNFNQALSLQQSVGDRQGQAHTLRSMGGVMAALGEQMEAQQNYSRAVELYQSLGDRYGAAAALFGKARAEMEPALDIVESIRARVFSSELRTSYLASVQNYYKFYTDLLMQLYQHEPSAGHVAAALQTNERARARSLLDMLTEARADIRQGVDPTLLDRERSLQQLLNAKHERLTRLLSGKHTEEQATAAKKEVEAFLTEYQEVQGQIRARSPRYAALTQPQPLGLKEIQQQVLDEDTLLLEYALGEERSFLWAVTTTSIKSYELPKRAEIEAAAKQLYEWILTYADALHPKEVAALSQMLLGPAADQLNKKRLVIVADGWLQYLPFAALPKPGIRDQGSGISGGTTGHESRVTNHEPLIVAHEIVHLPSASVLAVLRKELAGRPAAPKTVAVLADPVFQSNDPRLGQGKNKGRAKSTAALVHARTRAGETPALPGQSQTPTGADDTIGEPAVLRSGRESGVLSFDRLPQSRVEANQIAALVPKDRCLKALDFAANRATATSPELGQNRIVHFATHGLINNVHPELSGVVLSLVDEKGRMQDGFLRLHDVFNLQLGADVVVLSACQTALGKEIKGEGLVGLTRGFMYAGAPRVVASLWKVDDEATADLMKRFYRGMLKDGLRPAAALRAAQMELRQTKRWRSPKYWAGFVLQGEWQ